MVFHIDHSLLLYSYIYSFLNFWFYRESCFFTLDFKGTCNALSSDSIEFDNFAPVVIREITIIIPSDLEIYQLMILNVNMGGSIVSDIFSWIYWKGASFQ